MSSDKGTYICVYDDQGGRMVVQYADLGHLDARVLEWVHSGRDSLLDLTTTAGNVYRIRASSVQSFSVSTPAGRLRAMELDREAMAEEKANRQTLGMWSGDE